MATIFQSLRSSNMPKRLLRYALSRLELLDADALDMDNLDLAIGRNSVFEFRDVGIKLPKLERLLELPPLFRLQKAKVLVLRITIPVDFYTSPIKVEVDGVDVRLKVLSGEEPKTRQSGRETGTASPAVPTTVDLAQCFLETQPLDEKKKLQEELAAETQDLGASITVSDDGSEDESPSGTGQALSLPAFLADFLQGVVDRTQIRIQAVTFQLDIELPLEPNTSAPDPVTFQVALERVDVEGVTMHAETGGEAPTIVPREGKRHISLAHVRAYLVSEANVFSAFARSSGMSSPSISQSSASRTRMSPETVFQLRDSEDALGIPYEFPSQPEEADGEEESPATPRASVYCDFAQAQHASLPSSALLERDIPQHASLRREAQSDPTRLSPDGLHLRRASTPGSEYSSGASDNSAIEPEEDLTQSHVYTHEEAESMYQSAFSQAPSQSSKSMMPGSWDDTPSPEGSPEKRPAQCGSPPSPSTKQISSHSSEIQATSEETPLNEADALPLEEPPVEPDTAGSVEEPAGAPPFAGMPEPAPEPDFSLLQDDVATPRGPTRLVKEIMSLNNISIYVPARHKHIQLDPEARQEHTGGLEELKTTNIPGAFSIYSSPSVSHSVHPSAKPSPSPTTRPLEQHVEVILSPLELRFDSSLGFLLAALVSKLLSALKGCRGQPPRPSSETHGTDQSATTPLPGFQLISEQISIQFLHHLAGISDTAERFMDANAFQFAHEILLRADVKDLRMTVASTPTGTNTALNIGKFKLGYANGDIVTFNSDLQMRASVRDVFPSSGADISVKLESSGDMARAEVLTLPVHVQIDLQRLDETFIWFGGLSSFLNAGSSMTSSTSASLKTIPPTSPKPRGVRFETPINPNDLSAASGNKVDLRSAGLYLDLVGKDCSLSLETSAVKVVGRGEGIGLAISEMRLSGPHFKHGQGNTPITAEVSNTRLEYLANPKDVDLERLLELITPSKVKFDEDDEIMVDTLLKQRRKGPVLRASVNDFNLRVGQIPQLSCLPALGEEISRLATVAKYLPEDDRPGLLTLGRLQRLSAVVDCGGKLGKLNAVLGGFEVAHISLPSLLAIGINSLAVNRNNKEVLVGSSISESTLPLQVPVLMARMIGDEIEPTIKLRLQRLAFEYRVPTVMDILDLADDATPQDFEATLAASVANLGEHAHATLTARLPPLSPSPGLALAKDNKPMTLDLAFRDCLIGLNPLNLKSKLTVALTEAHLRAVLPRNSDCSAVLDVKKASLLLTDDVSMLGDKEALPASHRRVSNAPSQQVAELCARGFVDICYISSAKVTVKITEPLEDDQRHLYVDLRDDLLVLETCADSTQTLIALGNALKPPTPPTKENKYRTNVVPVQDLLASISAEAFGRPEGDYDFDNDFAIAQELGGEEVDETASDASPLEIHSRYYEDTPDGETLFDAGSMTSSHVATTQDTADGVLLDFNAAGGTEFDSDSELVVEENYFDKKPAAAETARVWNSSHNRYDRAPEGLVNRSPLKVCVRDVHVIWNLFDGYDWLHTRDVISKAVQDVESKAYERRARSERRTMYDDEAGDEETVIGDFLFNSIYIGIPANRDPRELAQAINHELNDNTTETESVATTTLTATTHRTGMPHRSRKKLKLNRSKHHKITFELKGLNVDLVAFPPDSGETQSSIDIRVQDLDIFDHVPTSTWKKFATYDQDAGERQMGSSMVHLELLNVKPIAELAASEIVMRATLLPLRLHVDQDALDFITRFFEFKDDSVPLHSSPSDIPFLQRAEVHDVPVKLDFKPKRVDYAGLRSGHTTEFMNFITLDEARLVLRHTIIYGVSGFERLGKTLNDIWMPDVKRNQLPTVLAGLAPVRSIVNLGSGFKNLIEIPLKEYKKDGRAFRSISKGATAFARTTGTELVKLGAKVAVGTQYALQGAEGLLVKPGRDNREDDDTDTEEQRQISLYADQPTGVIQGLRGGYASLRRDLIIATDAIIAVPGEVMESQNAQGAAKAVLRRAPTIIFRPAIGATKAIGQTLMGATNSLDPQNRRRVEEKYKKH